MKVSVILGVYNGSKYIERSVNSILKQTFKDLELIICDDSSTDDTVKILETLKNNDNRIRIIQNKSNMGLAKSLNRCLEIAEGEYIARMDDDDISHPERIEKQVLFLDSFKEYSIVSCSYNLFDDNGIWGSNKFYGEKSILDIYKGNGFAHPTVVIRKSALDSVRGYTEGEKTIRIEDFDLWCKLYNNGFKGYTLKEILFDYNESRDSFKKRKYKYRIIESKLKLQWAVKLNLGLQFKLLSIRPLLVGILPKKILMLYHLIKFKKIL